MFPSVLEANTILPLRVLWGSPHLSSHLRESLTLWFSTTGPWPSTGPQIPPAGLQLSYSHRIDSGFRHASAGIKRWKTTAWRVWGFASLLFLYAEAPEPTTKSSRGRTQMQSETKEQKLPKPQECSEFFNFLAFFMGTHTQLCLQFTPCSVLRGQSWWTQGARCGIGD